MPVVCFFALTAMRVLLFRHGRPATWWWERILVNASWAWTAATPVVLIGAVSLGMSRRRRREDLGERIDNFVCFRIVSRGRNVPAIVDTVDACRAAMSARPLFPYRIEVVVDRDVDLVEAFDLHILRVPDEYETPKGSRFKARALHYATQAIPLPDHAWTFHLDEESRVTDGLIGGIRDAIVEEEARVAAGDCARIGQGAIVYTSNLREHPLLTLADSLRTGDDLTRFHTQFRSGRMFCGIHGSFILCRASVEAVVSFDVGPEGSITEDAWWAYEQAANGAGFRWVDGYLVEQSPESWRHHLADGAARDFDLLHGPSRVAQTSAVGVFDLAAISPPEPGVVVDKLPSVAWAAQYYGFGATWNRYLLLDRKESRPIAIDVISAGNASRFDDRTLASCFGFHDWQIRQQRLITLAGGHRAEWIVHRIHTRKGAAAAGISADRDRTTAVLSWRQETTAGTIEQVTLQMQVDSVDVTPVTLTATADRLVALIAAS